MLSGLKVIVPEHELTVCGSDTGKVGSCRCGGWSVSEQSDSDEVTTLYLGHLAEVGAVHPGACDVCQSGIATVRHGCVELCSRCGWLEYQAEVAEMSGRSEGHPDRREDPDRSDALVAVA